MSDAGAATRPPGEVLARRLARVRDAGLLAFAVLAVVTILRAFQSFAFDDAYISYRYAENIAHGRGFVFNPGERVLGTSSPLFTLLLAACRFLGIDVPTAGGLFTVLSLAFVALAGAWVTRRYRCPDLGVLFAVAVLWGCGGPFGFWGLETTFLSALLLIAWICALTGRRTTAGVVTGLACVTRYDALAFAGVLLALLWLEDRRVPWRTGLAAAAVTAPWLLFSLLYFGTVLPNTLGAKAHDVSMATYLVGSLKVVERRFWLPFSGPLGQPGGLAGLVLLLLVGGLAVRLPVLGRRRPLLLVLVVYPLGLWLTYSFIGPPLEHQWYLLPGFYLLMLGAILAWGSVLEGWRTAPWSTVLALAVLAVGTVFLPFTVGRHARIVDSTHYRARIGTYRFLASWLVQHGLTDLRLFTLEPGYLSYLSGNPVVDGAGLVTEGIHFHGPPDRKTPFSEVVREQHPELAVFHYHPPLRGSPGGFVPLYLTAIKVLSIRQDVLVERLAGLAQDWLRRDYPYPEAVVLGHPFAFDFERGHTYGWWGARRVVGHPVELRLDGRELADDYLTTHRAVTGREICALTGPPFRIDFDELDFWFLGTGGAETRAELLVNGQVVLSTDGGAGTEPVELHWPVHSWRGKVGLLRLVDGSPAAFAAADRIRSVRHARTEVLDDFENGAYGERWQETFAAPPTGFLELARRYGLRFVLGRYSATSLFAGGRQVLKSRPFVLDHDGIAFTVFDFGGPRSEVRLEVDGRVVARRRGGNTRELAGVVWSLEAYQGGEAVLTVFDRSPRREVGIGIDDIVLFDEKPGHDSL